MYNIFMHLCMVKAVRLRNVAKRNGGQEEAIGTLVAIAETCLFAKRSGGGGRHTESDKER